MSAKKRDTRTIHFVSLGCPKNRVDTEVLAGMAVARGMTIVPEPEDADVIVVNTCGFIADAKEESVNTLLAMGRHRLEGRCQKLVASGCLSQRYPEEVAAEMPEIDCVLGTRAPETFDAILDEGDRVVEIGPADHFLQRPRTPRFVQPGAPSAYLKIADGCSRKCAFCAIPAIRGRARSRPVREIVAEARRLVRAGVVEINLVSQDTSGYGVDLGPDDDLVTLLEALDRVRGLRWIRLLYLYPDGVPDVLLAAVADLGKVVPYLDVPVQHASARVLRAMRRGHGVGALESLVERARRKVPGVFLRTTVLVGHPGETVEDVDRLLGFMERARFDHLGVFRYSDEEGTSSFGREPVPSRRDSYNRRRKVMAAQRRIARQKNRSLVGREVEVLVEGVADDAGYVLLGRHAGQAPEVDGVTYLVSSDAGMGEIVRARVIDFKDHDLVAQPV